MTTKVINGLALTLLVMAGSWWQAASAAEVTGLYQATVPVDSREDQKQRVRAFTAGMQEVLVKLTGRIDIATQPEIQAALRSPQSYAESWAYQTRPDLRTHEQKLQIDINYYQAGIQRLLDNAGIPLWPQTRPETLVWMIIQNEKGEKLLSDPGAGTGLEELQALQIQGTRFGLPGHVPLWDLEDQTALTQDQLWMLDEAAIRAASSRYQYESLLAIRLVKLVSGQVMGKSVHIFRDHVHETEVLEASLDDFLKATTTMVTKELADNYAVRVSSNKGGTGNESQLLLLSVEGVNGLTDYADVLHYVQSLTGITEVHVREARADTLTFSLNAGGQVRQLVENLAIDHKLQAVAKPATEAGNSQLHYRWQSR